MSENSWIPEELEDERDMGDTYEGDSENKPDEEGETQEQSTPTTEDQRKDTEETETQSQQTHELTIPAIGEQQNDTEETETQVQGQSIITSKQFKYKERLNEDHPTSDSTTSMHPIHTRKRKEIRISIPNKRPRIDPNTVAPESRQTEDTGVISKNKPNFKIRIPKRQPPRSPIEEDNNYTEHNTNITLSGGEKRKRQEEVEQEDAMSKSRVKRPRRRKDYAEYSEDPG
jgi:hypothetical protein